MNNTSPPHVPEHQTREMKELELPLNLKELNIAGPEDSSSQREIVLVDDKPQAEMTGEPGQQNKDQDEGEGEDVNQDEGSGRGCEAALYGPTSSSCHVSPLKPKPCPPTIVDKDLFEC